MVIGWTDPEGARPFPGALLLGYYDPDGRLTYAGRVGTGTLGILEPAPVLARSHLSL